MQQHRLWAKARLGSRDGLGNMSALTLPEELKPALAEMVSLSEEAFAELLRLLQSAPMSFSDDELADNVEAQAKQVSSDTVHAIIEMLVSLQWVRTSVNVPLDEFLGDVAEAVDESDLKESIKIQPEQLHQRLAAFLNVKAIIFAASARQLRRNYEHTFCNADLLTDIRPMFGSDGQGPLAAVVVHTLKISYHQRNELKDFFLALTSDDLDTLEELIEKARNQVEHLEPVLDAANISHPRLLPE